MSPPRGHRRPADGPNPGDAPTPREDDSLDLERVLDEMRRGATTWPPAHRNIFEEAIDKLREALEEVQATEEELRRQNEELAAAQLEAVIARERYAELFNFAPAAHLVTDLEGRILEANMQAGALLGLPQQELFGKRLPAFVPTSERRAFRGRLAQIGAEGKVHEWTLRLKPPDVPAFDAAVTVGVFRDADGERAELRWIVQDVTERIQAQEEAQRVHEVAVTRYRKLQGVTDVLLRHLELEELLRELLEAVRGAVGSDTATLLLPTPDGMNLAIRAAVGEEEGVVGEIRVPLGKGIAGRIAAERTPRIVSDLRKAKPYSEFLRRKLHSLVGVPLIMDDNVVGVVHAGTFQSHEFTEEDVLLLKLVSERAAVAIVNSRLYEAEQEAREAAERAANRLAFLAEASEVLSSSLDYEVLLQRIATLAVPRLADWCLVDVLGSDGSLRQLAMAHRDPSKEPLIRELRDRYPPEKERPHPLWKVLLSGEPLLAERITENDLAGRARDGEHLRLLLQLGIRSHIVVPLTARGRILGALSFISGNTDRRYSQEDLIFAEDLGRRAGIGVDNSQLYERQLHIARTLQRSLLPPSIPRIPGMELAARYRAAGEGNEVGGDFYDAFESSDGAWILTIGDVCGKGPEAAAVTGLARHTIRAVSIHEARPSRVLAMLNETIIRELSDERFCTVCCVRLRPGPDGARLTVCSGGHPLPLILRADGRLETAGEPSMLLGVLPEVELSDHIVDLGPGDTIVMFTDGVVEEIRGSDRSGPERLNDVLAQCRGLSAAAVAEAVEDSLLRFGPEAQRDDFAILVLRVEPGGSDPGLQNAG